jgi:hypothetical protein
MAATTEQGPVAAQRDHQIDVLRQGVELDGDGLARELEPVLARLRVDVCGDQHRDAVRVQPPGGLRRGRERSRAVVARVQDHPLGRRNRMNRNHYPN